MKKSIIKPLFALYHFGAFTNPKLIGKKYSFSVLTRFPHYRTSNTVTTDRCLFPHIKTATKNCLWIRKRVQHLSSFRAEKYLRALREEPGIACRKASSRHWFQHCFNIPRDAAGQCQQNCCWRIIKWDMSTSSESWDFPSSPGKEDEGSESRENPYLAVRWMSHRISNANFLHRFVIFVSFI